MKVGDLVQPTADAVRRFTELTANDRAVVLPPRALQQPWQLRLRFLHGRTVRCWDQAWFRLSPDLLLTDEHRSMIASAFVASFDGSLARGHAIHISLCCSPDALEACARIVGKRKAEVLQNFFYESLSCSGWDDAEYQARQELHFLDKIAAMETL